MNAYCALLLVDYTMSTGEPVSVVKLRVSLLMLWFGVSGLHQVKLKTMSCHIGKKFETNILMYLVVIADPISPVPGM